MPRPTLVVLVAPLALTAAASMLAPRLAAAACGRSDFVPWRPSDGCPTAGQSCLSIDQASPDDVVLTGFLLPKCDWDGVELRVTRSSSIVSCGGQTLRGGGDGTGIHVRSLGSFTLETNPVSCAAAASTGSLCNADSVDTALHDVTITGCRIEGFDKHRSISSPTVGWFSMTPAFSQSYGVWRAEDHYLAGDFDGDGAGDVMRIWRGPEDRAQLWAYYLSATGVVGSRNQDFSTAPGANDGAGFVVGRRWLVSDFDGDGKKDVALVYNRSGDARIWKHRSTGRAFAFVGIQTMETFVDTQRWLSGYFDSGVREDLLRISSHVWY